MNKAHSPHSATFTPKNNSGSNNNALNPSTSNLNPSLSRTRSTSAFKNLYAQRLRQGSTSLITPIEKREFNDDDSSDQNGYDDLIDIENDDENDSGIGGKQQNRLQKIIHQSDGKSTMRKTGHDHIPKSVMASIADSQELLIPIRVEIDMNGSVLHDTFTWNLNEKALTPEKFASLLCKDLDIPISVHVPQIIASFRSQMAEYSQFYIEQDQPQFPDSRIIINLDLSIGQLNLKDKFEWDMSSNLSPEVFARQLCADLQMGGEYVAVIAHAIHEQILKARLEDDMDPLKPLECGFRDERDAPEWAPWIEPITETDFERMKIHNERKSRRLRRESKGPLRRRTTYHDRRASEVVPELILPADWKCAHCKSSSTVNPVREAEDNGKVCFPCASWFVVNQALPQHRLDLFKYGVL